MRSLRCSGAAVMAGLNVISTFGCNAGLVLAGPRVYYAMARDGLFFERAGQLHPARRTPIFGLATQAIWASVLCLSGTSNQLLDYVIFASVVFYFLATLSLFRLRRIRPKKSRDREVPQCAVSFLLLDERRAANHARFDTRAYVGLAALQCELDYLSAGLGRILPTPLLEGTAGEKPALPYAHCHGASVVLESVHPLASSGENLCL